MPKKYLNYLGNHIPFDNEAGFTGTCRYASVYAHDSFELSRRDDLISWSKASSWTVTGPSSTSSM